LAVSAILLAQVGVCFWQHLGNTRYFAWAPNDYVVTYALHVSVGGRALSPPEISSRYRLSLANRLSQTAKQNLGLARVERYVWEDPPQHLINRLKWYEQTYDSADRDRVSLIYQLDGGPVRQWRWPT
jgi:hypothetical protein